MPDNFTMRIDGLDRVMSDFEKAGVNYRPLVQQAMGKATLHLKNTIQENITNKGIAFQGNLRRSVQVREATADKGVIGVGEKYGGAVEFGRRPGKMPPVAAIERWAAIKLGAPGAGFVIARKIGMKGTKPQPFVEPAFRSEAEKVVNYFKDAVDVVFSMMAGK